MLFSFLKSVLKFRAVRPTGNAVNFGLQGSNFFMAGDYRSAIVSFRQHLELFPHDVEVLNNLGVCLGNIGDHVGGARCFEMAFALDDTYIPAVNNYAGLLKDRGQSDKAIALLSKAKITDPDSPHADAIYGATAFFLGNPKLGNKHALKAWLADFQCLRLANAYLFHGAYIDDSEAQSAAEHKFWAETLAPVRSGQDEIDLALDTLPEKNPLKIRIAYWSPDFRNHSVRYFSRPLMENHDRETFEIFVYHDSPESDAQTEIVRADADCFLNVNEYSDQKLLALMRAHELDVLVELAGQSSANRVNLLQERIATLQLTGIGYPPTTGLSNIDGKLLDRHIADEESPRYYTEVPLVLPTSFWCFDPKEAPEINPEPPAARNGYTTFACVGNISKINPRMLACWASILAQVPGSKLLLRAINLLDPAAEKAVREQVEMAGIPGARVELLKPELGAEYFKSYNEIDIILDTYPFNGGTTTCFATYMGVPVVSMAGRSLISRMGKSVLNNLGLSDWVVDDEVSYIKRAVAGANDLDVLKVFRAEARLRYSKTALGSGILFAREFEAACISMLEDKKSGKSRQASCVADLPEQELVRRAYVVFRYGHNEAAQRIVDYCLRVYPDCGSARIQWTQRLTSEGKFREAAAYLRERLPAFSVIDRVKSLVNIARFQFQADEYALAARAIEEASSFADLSGSDFLQIKMLRACIEARAGLILPTRLEENFRPVCLKVILVCSGEKEFQAMQTRIQERCPGHSGLDVEFIQCQEDKKGRVYENAIYESDADYVLWIHKNVDIYNPHFFSTIIDSLQRCDILSFGGAREWDRLDWRLSPAANKAACFIVPSGEQSAYEVQALGVASACFVENLGVLDGAMMAVRCDSLKKVDRLEFDIMLEGGGALMEESFSYLAGQAGLRLAVHQALGVVVDWRIELFAKHLSDVRWSIAQSHDFQAFVDLEEDRVIISAPVMTPALGLAVQQLYFRT
jgi:protein O-GlcNAc transferase